jgi:histidine triad (HIT) family protein
VTGTTRVDSVRECLFCRIVEGETPARTVLATPETVGFLDHRPVFKGHVLLVPRRHVATFIDLPDGLRDPFFLAGQQVAAAMVTALGAQGSFVAMNNTVSQSVPHLHLHVVPRTKGDGLRGFFWPRHKYSSEVEMQEYADRLAAAVRSDPTRGD